jgi:adenylate cyclase
MGSRSPIPDAVDLGMRGWTLIWRNIQQPLKERREGVNDARALFDRALQIDPNDADALAGSAYAYYSDRLFAGGDPGTDYEAKVLGQANRAIVLAPDNVRAYYVKSSYLTHSQRPREGLAVAEAGLVINPNFAMLLTSRILAENSLGQFEQAKADAQRAMRLSPRDPYLRTLHVEIGTEPRPLERGHRPISPSDRLGL